MPTTAIGFGAISLFTYSLDLSILHLVHRELGWPYPVSVTIGYVIAFGLAFVLNRWLNFRAHGHVGAQGGRYVLTVLANYALFIVGVSTVLEWAGVHYLVARVLAGLCEAVFMYLMLRWFVFAFRRPRRPGP